MRAIIPTILEKNINEFKKRLKIAELLSKRIQIDVADGKFVKNKTIGIKELKKIKSKSKIEYHLMVQNPEKYIDVLSKNADLITVHIEIRNPEKYIDKIAKKGLKVGIAINPKTNPKKLIPVMKKVKKVIVLTVSPGWQGRKFFPPALKKIRVIKKMNKKVIVQVDGGINEKTINLAEKAGADEFVVGSAIVKAENPKKEYEKLKNGA